MALPPALGWHRCPHHCKSSGSAALMFLHTHAHASPEKPRAGRASLNTLLPSAS